MSFNWMRGRRRSNQVSCIHSFAPSPTSPGKNPKDSPRPEPAQIISEGSFVGASGKQPAALRCRLKMLLIGLCCQMNKLKSCCFLDGNLLGGGSAAVHLCPEELAALTVMPT